MEKSIILQEVTVNAPVSEVWEALTDKNKLKKWFFDIKNFKPESGTRFKFYGEKKRKKFPTTCKIINVEFEKRISYTWSYDDLPAETIVTFQLFAKDGSTRVKFSHEGLDKIPPQKEIEDHLEGWEHIINSLKEYVERPTLSRV